jgi:hypothetical protein
MLCLLLWQVGIGFLLPLYFLYTTELHSRRKFVASLRYSGLDVEWAGPHPDEFFLGLAFAGMIVIYCTVVGYCHYPWKCILWLFL